LKIYTDADWGQDLNSRKSTEGCISLLGTCPINWSSQLQRTVALSSTEAEFMALKSADQEAIYLQNILNWLEDYKILSIPNRFSTILVDNQGAKSLSESSTHHKRTKHIDIAYHFIRQSVEDGKVKVVYIPTKLQLADPLTKGVFKPELDWFKETIGLRAL